jgi:hypothetical protein
MPAQRKSKATKTKTSEALKPEQPSKSKESLNVINPDKHPHAYAVNKTLKEARESGTYMTTDKLKKAATPASFKADEPRPKRFSCCEAFAEYIGWDIVDSWVEKVKGKIKEGDTTCLLFMLERVFPKGKPDRKIKSSIRDLVTLEDVHKAYTTIINETAVGDLDVDDAKILTDIIAKKESVLTVSIAEEIEGKLKKLREHITQRSVFKQING